MAIYPLNTIHGEDNINILTQGQTSKMMMAVKCFVDRYKNVTSPT